MTDHESESHLEPLSRSAARLVYENELRSAAYHAAFAVGGVLLLLVACWWAGVRFGSGLVLIVGMLALAAGGFVHEWWTLRKRGPVPALDPAAVAAHQAAVARHQATLAARPARMTWGLLGCIGAASACQLLARGSSFDAAALVKPLAREGEWWRLVTAAYLHGGIWHFWLNMSSLRALGPLLEAYSPRTRLPLVWLVSALAGSVASLVFLPNATSVGASGGILGLAAYLWVLARRRPHVLPPWLGSGLTMTFLMNAFLGVFGYAVIDNAAHAGGAAAGALLGVVTIPRTTPNETQGEMRERDPRDALDAFGWLSACLVVLGAAFTIGKLLGTRD